MHAKDGGVHRPATEARHQLQISRAISKRTTCDPHGLQILASVFHTRRPHYGSTKRAPCIYAPARPEAPLLTTAPCCARPPPRHLLSKWRTSPSPSPQGLSALHPKCGFFVCRTGDVTDGRGRHHSIVSSASLCLGERPRHRYPWRVAVLGKNGLPLQPGNLAAASSQKVQLGCAGAFP